MRARPWQGRPHPWSSRPRMSVRRSPHRIKRFLTRYGPGPELTVALRDPRKARGQRWSFAMLLDTLLLGMLLWCRTLREVETKSERAGPRVPDSTLAYVLERIDPAPFRSQVVAQVRRQARAKALAPEGLPFGVVAIDGKTTWVGPWSADPACQLQDGKYHLRVLRAVLTSARSRPCIDQGIIGATTNDMGQFPIFWRAFVKTYGRSGLFGAVTLDAGFASKENAALVDGDHVAYILNIKDNQPTLRAELARVLGGPDARPVWTTPWERAHGTVIQRQLFRTADVAGWDDWAHLRQGWLVRQTTRTKDGKVTVFDRYYITNLVWGALGPRQILRVIRDHWGIENDCNWTFDVVWKEDTHAWTANKKQVAGRWPLRVQMWLRVLAYNLLTWLLRVHLRAAGFRRMTWAQLRDALEQVLLPVVSPLALEVAFATLA